MRGSGSANSHSLRGEVTQKFTAHNSSYPPSPSPSQTAAGMMTTVTSPSGDGKVVLFDQEDSGLGSMHGYPSIDSLSVELSGQEVQFPTPAPATTTTTTTPSPLPCSPLLALAGELSNLKLTSAQDVDTRDSGPGGCCPVRMGLLERHARGGGGLEHGHTSIACDNNDSGNFSITTTSACTAGLDFDDDTTSAPRQQQHHHHHQQQQNEADSEVAERLGTSSEDDGGVEARPGPCGVSGARQEQRSAAAAAVEASRKQFLMTVTPEQRVALYHGDADGDNLLHLSIINGRVDLALLVMSLAPDYLWLSFPNLLRQSPLHLAVLTGHARLVRRLVCAGALVDCQDARGDTPLHVACRLGHDAIVKALLTPVRYEETVQNPWEIPYQRLPQDLAVQNFDGQTPLHVAVVADRERAARMLLEAGADPMVGHAKSGRTAVHLAAEWGRLGLLQLLVSRPDVDLARHDYSGLTAAQLALGRNLVHVASVLQQLEPSYHHHHHHHHGSDSDSDMTLVDSDSDSDFLEEGMQ